MKADKGKIAAVLIGLTSTLGLWQNCSQGGVNFQSTTSSADKVVTPHAPTEGDPVIEIGEPVTDIADVTTSQDQGSNEAPGMGAAPMDTASTDVDSDEASEPAPLPITHNEEHSDFEALSRCQGLDIVDLQFNILSVEVVVKSSGRARSVFVVPSLSGKIKLSKLFEGIHVQSVGDIDGEKAEIRLVFADQDNVAITKDGRSITLTSLNSHSHGWKLKMRERVRLHDRHGYKLKIAMVLSEVLHQDGDHCMLQPKAHQVELAAR